MKLRNNTIIGNRFSARHVRIAGKSATTLCLGATVLFHVLLTGCGGQIEQPLSRDADAATAAAATFVSDDPDARGLVLNTGNSTAGYVLFSPLLSNITYLVDVNGQVVHMWESEYAPGAGLYLLDNGNLLRSARDPEITSFRSGGVGGLIEEFDWHGEKVWTWGIGSSQGVLHHDIEPLPNGNVLALGWEVKDSATATAAGRRPEKLPEQGLWPDYLVEIEKLPPDSGQVVWGWHVWDHLVQDRDPLSKRYAPPADHPHRVDINSDREAKVIDDEELAQLKAIGYVPEDAKKDDLKSDFLHINAVAYNSHLDHIALSVPQLGEIWILDHSTTTAEAAGSTGGRSGFGGQLLYRWGNPRTYGRGDSSDQQLFYQHDVHWIPDGLKGAGNLMVFNNGGGRPDGDWSSVLEIVPPLNKNGSYEIESQLSFGPDKPHWSYEAPKKESFFAPFISGAHRTTDGHTMICSGPDGRFFEINHEGTVVWEYRNPFSGEIRNSDGTMPQPGLDARPFATFRATKIAANHPALMGRDLRPLDPQPDIWRPKTEVDSTVVE